MNDLPLALRTSNGHQINNILWDITNQTIGYSNKDERVKNGDVKRFQVYIDDIIFGSNNMQLVKEFSKHIQGEFEMSLMAELSYFLGLQIKQLNEGTFMCQTKYYNRLLKRFGMEDAKSIDTSMLTNGNLEKNENGKDIDVNKYRGMISYLLYLIASRTNIMFSACMCDHY
ncbi:uncharacterized mitochondrial protein AtMg00810-like [Lathyrus oleraceus]|uniref:uncharacterized mitochondrial protein AtMg00810-like n=1 Tax=Pisum sativum TaxID=3888 RepID=UPI0021D3C916|nr:uncharacterized mitochondrial protein AtMg00810-like [Pisum sativum]